MLENVEWKDDVMPEFMDGKNIFDYIDPEIERKIALLEDAEERILEQMYQDKAINEEDGDISLDDELIEAHDKMMINKEKLRIKHQLVVGSQLPKKVRGLTETEELMQKIRWDKGELGTKFLSQRTKRAEFIKKRKNSTSQKNSMIKTENDEDMDMSEMMGLDDEAYNNKIKQLENKKKDESQKKIVTERIKRKLQKKLSRQAKVNDADRRIGTKLPKHLNSGHRGIGKTDYR